MDPAERLMLRLGDGERAGLGLGGGQLEVEVNNGVIDQNVVIVLAIHVGDVLKLFGELVCGQIGLDVDVVRDGQDPLVDLDDLAGADVDDDDVVVLDIQAGEVVVGLGGLEGLRGDALVADVQ
jgi:hypothetical protein